MTADPGAPIPLCDTQAQYLALQPELEAAALEVLRSGRYILGPEVEGFEEEMATYCQTAHAVGCGSGSDALALALQAAGLKPGDEVILPPFTFFATVGAVCRAGLAPVFADIEPHSYNLDPNKVAEKITPRTRAVLPVHLFGQCVEMDPILDLAQRHNLIVIEDVAQAIGAEYRGQRSGSMGSFGCFSFYPSKNLAAYGEAGIVTTNNEEWARRLRHLRVHGMEPKYYHQEIGWNARLDALQAALLRVKLPHLDRWTDARQAAARRYEALFSDRGMGDMISTPSALPERRHAFNQYVIEVGHGRRDELIEHLRRDRIGCEIYYPVPLHLQECLSHLGHQPGDFPISEAACHSVLALPMFPELAEEQQARVVESVARLFGMGATRLAA